MKKKYRIKDSREIKKILDNKNFFSSKTLTLYTKQRNLEHARVAISVSKKLGNAVVRNKIKRQIRMMIQKVYTFDEIFDTIVFVRNAYTEHHYADNEKNLQYTYLKARKKYD